MSGWGSTGGGATAGASALDRREWLDWRRQGIGGSDAAVIVGLDPYRSPMELWLNKTGQLPDQDESEAMRWGNLLEAPIVSEFQRRTGLYVIDRQVMVEHRERPWMRATLDGRVYESQGRDSQLGIYEGKTTSAMRFGMHWGEEPPEWVLCQVQHNMAVDDVDHAWVTCLIGGQKLLWYEVERDDGLIEQLMDAEEYFWEHHVLARVPPPASGRGELEALKTAFRQAAPDVPGVELDRDLAYNLITCYLSHKAAEKEAGERAAAAQADLCALLGEAQAGRVNDQDVITWRMTERRTFDQQQFAAEYPGLAQRYTKTSSVRTFRVARDWRQVVEDTQR